jgi:hypothetical protein
MTARIKEIENYLEDSINLGRDDALFLLSELTRLQEEVSKMENVAPIAKVTIGDDYSVMSISQYAPGLPPGEHDLYCVPTTKPD